MGKMQPLVRNLILEKCIFTPGYYRKQLAAACCRAASPARAEMTLGVGRAKRANCLKIDIFHTLENFQFSIFLFVYILTISQ